MRTLAVIVGLALGAVTPAVAQDGSEVSAQRTPESAQRFLTQFLGENKFGALLTARLRDGGYGPYLASETGAWAYTYGLVAGWQAGDRCRSRIQLASVRTNFDGPSYAFTPQFVGLDIDWSQVTAVQVEPPSTGFQVRTSDGPPIQRHAFKVAPTVREGHHWVPALLFDSKEDADRVANAMDFLRTNCIVAADTGF